MNIPAVPPRRGTHPLVLCMGAAAVLSLVASACGGGSPTAAKTVSTTTTTAAAGAVPTSGTRPPGSPRSRRPPQARSFWSRGTP